MVSLESVRDNLAEEANRILILMQEGDAEQGFIDPEWADSMFRVWELTRSAVQTLNILLASP